jgi:hypothetical protein
MFPGINPHRPKLGFMVEAFGFVNLFGNFIYSKVNNLHRV